MAVLAHTAPAAAEAPAFGLFGGTGLLRMPTARLAPEGTLALGATAGEASLDLFATAAPLPRLELSLGRTVHENTFPSRTGEVKLLLLRESPDHPQLALGARTLGKAGGAGYLVLSRRLGNLDISAGLGGGAVAGRGGFDLPLSDGRLAPFGGIEAATPVQDLNLRLEWDPTPRSGRTAPLRSSINLGAVWQPLPGVDLGVGWMNGETLMARLALRFPLTRLPVPAPPAAPEGALARPGPASPATAEQRLRNRLQEAGFSPVAVAATDTAAGVRLDRLPAGPEARTIGRAARIMAAEAPPSAERLDVTLHPDGLSGTTVSLMRRELERASAHRGSPAEIWRTARLSPADPPPSMPERWDLRVMPRLVIDPWSRDRILGGRVMLDGSVAHRWGSGWRFGTGLRGNIQADLPDPGFSASDEGRAIRRDLAYYAATPLVVEHLFMGWAGSVAPEWHLRLDAGWLDETFGGYGAELLWRPQGQRWAAGIAADAVWRRWPGNGLLVEPGALHSGFLSLYYEGAGIATDGALHLGRYLAGDVGATLEWGYRVGSGARLSGWGTWTVSGSGGIAGLRLSIPLGRPAPWATVSAEAEFRPLAQDAGQRIEHRLPLYDMTGPASAGRIIAGWPHITD